MVKVEIDPGVCGLKTVIYAESEDMQSTVVKTESQCPHIMEMVSILGVLDGYHEVFSCFGEGEVFKAANQCCKHAACPVPTAIIKGIEVECGLALPRTVKIVISKD